MVQNTGSKDHKAEIIRCIELNKSIDSKCMIKEVSFSIFGNCLNWIIGKNGSGKSTVVRILAGLLEIDSGQIIYSTKRMAVLLEYECLDTRMTGLDNIYFFMSLKEQELDFNKLKYYASLLGIFDDLIRDVDEYSKGMKRKLSILIVMLCNADILLLDEPFSGLDKEIREKFIYELRNDERTIVIVDHEIQSFDKTDHVIMMESGKVKHRNF